MNSRLLHKHTLTATTVLMPLLACPLGLAADQDVAVWEQYRRIGVQALNNGQYVEAIENLVRAISRAQQVNDVKNTDVVAEMRTQVGTAYLALADHPRQKNKRRSRLEAAARSFESAMQLYIRIYTEDSLIAADAIDRYAQAREQIYNASGNREFATLYNRLHASPWLSGNVHELYLKVLTVREKHLGENHPDVMLYRRNVYRKLYVFAAEFRRKGQDSTNLDTRRKAQTFVSTLMQLADELKSTDRRLSDDTVTTRPATNP